MPDAEQRSSSSSPRTARRPVLLVVIVTMASTVFAAGTAAPLNGLDVRRCCSPPWSRRSPAASTVLAKQRPLIRQDARVARGDLSRQVDRGGLIGLMSSV
jgi:hypothetical protein